MIRSMTGFGEASGATAAGTLRVELRTVNHRYLNINSRLPSALARFETEFRDWFKSYFARGHVNCTARWEMNGAEGSGTMYRLDEEKVSNYLKLFSELSERFGIGGSPDLSTITRFNDIIVRSDGDELPPEIDPDQIQAIFQEAAARVVDMREEEGKRLEVDL